MRDNRRFPRRFFKAAFLALLALPVWTPAGSAANRMEKDCVSCHKHLSRTTGRDRLAPHKAEGVSPHRKPSPAVPADQPPAPTIKR